MLEIYKTVLEGGTGEIVEKNPDLSQPCVRLKAKRKHWLFWKK